MSKWEEGLMQTGDRVRHRDVNLWSDQGTLISIGREPRGGDCKVRWDRWPLIKSEECQFNLEKVPEGAEEKS